MDYTQQSPGPSSTRISDLPNNPHMEPITVGRPKSEMVIPNTSPYQPINDVHKNPYGVEKPDQLPDFSYKQPQMPPPYPNTANREQYELPSRDIPRDTTHLTMDDQQHVNYMPKPKLTGDFIAQHDYDQDIVRRKQQSSKTTQSWIDDLWDEWKIPVILACMFLLFQLPSFNLLFYTYAQRIPLELFGADGTPTMLGLLFKSAMFGALYYFFERGMKTIV